MKLASTAVAAMLAAAMSFVAQAQTIPLAQGQGLTFNDPVLGQPVDVLYAGGYGQIEFSQGLLNDPMVDPIVSDGIRGAQQFFNSARTTTTGTGGAVVTEYFDVNYVWNESTRSDTSWQDASAESLSINATGPQAGQFGVVGLSGGFSLTSQRQGAGNLSGGTVQFNNLRVDLVNQQVIADVSGSPAYGAGFSRPDTPIWSFASSVTGPTGISLASLRSSDPVSALQSDGFTVVDASSATIYQQSSCFASGSGLGYPGGSGGYWYPCTVPAGTAHYVAARADLMLDNLELTNAATQAIADGLGMLPTGASMAVLEQVNTENGKWGSMRVGLFLRAGSMNSYNWPALPASIPEPSTYFMMGLGLVGILLAKRR